MFELVLQLNQKTHAGRWWRRRWFTSNELFLVSDLRLIFFPCTTQTSREYSNMQHYMFELKNHCQSTTLAYMVLENYFIAMCSPKGISWFSSRYLYQLHRSRYTNIKCSTGFWWHPCQTASYYTPCRVCMLLVLVTRERCDGRRRMRGDEQWTNLRYAHMGRNGAECMCLYGEWYFRQFTLPLPKASDDLLFPMCLFAASEVCSLFVVSVIEGRQKHCQTTVKLCIIWLQHLACILFLVGLVTPWSPPVLPFPWFWL